VHGQEVRKMHPDDAKVSGSQRSEAEAYGKAEGNRSIVNRKS
jgi:hypothetical protein